MDKIEELLPASELVSLSVELASAYVANNSVPASELTKLLADIHGALRGMNGNGAPTAPAPEEKLSPAVPIKKSVTPDFIICLEDGKSFKSLRRHLQTKYGMTPEQYRAKWNLASDYPMVAPNYAAARSAWAKASGLGQLRTEKTTTASTAVLQKVTETPSKAAKAPEEPEPAVPQKRRGGRPASSATSDEVAASPAPAKIPSGAGRKTAKPATSTAKKTTRKASAK